MTNLNGYVWDNSNAFGAPRRRADSAPVATSGLTISEPINSRAETYRSPGDNSSPAGETIAAIIGTSSFDGKIVWWDDFRLIDGKVIANFAMVFADCIFTDSASLLKLFADEILVISNVTPTRQSSQNIRFYDGSQTAVDPLLTEKLGAAGASAWPGFVYAVFEDFDCGLYGNRIPLIRVVLSGAVTDVAASEEQSTLTFGAFGGGYSNGSGAFTVDPIRKHHYQIVSDGSTFYVVTIDVVTNVEINRAVIVHGLLDLVGIDFPVTLQGTDYIACSLLRDDVPSHDDVVPALLNVQTGVVVASLAIVNNWDLSPKRSIMLRSTGATTFLVVGSRRDSADTPTYSAFSAFVADTTNRTLAWIIHPSTSPSLAGNGTAAHSCDFGRVVNGVATVWWTDGHPTEIGSVVVAQVGETGFTSGYFYTETVSGKAPIGVAYDPTRNILVVYRADGSFLKLDGTTGSLLSTHSGAITDYNINIWSKDPAGAVEYDGFHHAHRPGYILATRGDVHGDIYEIDLNTLAATLLIDRSDFSNDDEGVYFDKYLGVMTEGSDTAGIINKVSLGGKTPNTVDLEDIFTQLATFDDRFVSGDLTFSGFAGNECSGLKLVNDTTVDNLENSIAELYDVKIVESDGKRKYFFPKRDGSFAIDVTLTADDFIEAGSTTIEKTIGAGEDEFAGCTVQFFDVDADYKKIDQTYRRPIGIYDVTRSKKVRTINTVLSMTASQAMELATKAVFRSVLGNEAYFFGLVPGLSHVEPADIIQFPFRDFTIIARVKEATLGADYTQEVRAYQYLQYADATFTGAPLDEPDDAAVSIHMRFIYLDIPLLSYAHDLDGAGLVQYAQISGYGPGLVTGSVFKAPDGETFTNQGTKFSITPLVGAVTAISGTPTDPFTKDETNTLTVLVNAGDIDDLVTITDTQFEAGLNIAAAGQPGRWVLVWFQTVSSSSGVATLSDLMWGVNGSEVWIDDLAVGDLFVLLKAEHYIRFRNDVVSLDDTFYYKAAHPSVPLWSVPTFTYAASGVAETPYAPTNLSADVSGSDIVITWDYRSRIASGTNPSDHGEASLSFEIDIVGTGSPEVVRTLTATTNSKTYAAADITTDFGSIPDELTFRVYMMSAIVGRGYAGEVTISLNGFALETGDALLLETGDELRLE